MGSCTTKNITTATTATTASTTATYNNNNNNNITANTNHAATTTATTTVATTAATSNNTTTVTTHTTTTNTTTATSPTYTQTNTVIDAQSNLYRKRDLYFIYALSLPLISIINYYLVFSYLCFVLLSATERSEYPLGVE